MNGVALHAHHLRLDQGWPFAAPCPFACLVASVIYLAGIGAVDDDAGNTIGDCALGEVLHAELHVRRSGVCPQIIFDQQHESEVLHCSKVQPLVRHPRGLTAIADVSHDCNVFSL